MDCQGKMKNEGKIQKNTLENNQNFFPILHKERRKNRKRGQAGKRRNMFKDKN